MSTPNPPSNQPYTRVYGEPKSIGELLFPSSTTNLVQPAKPAASVSRTPILDYVSRFRGNAPVQAPTPAPVAPPSPPAVNPIYDQYMQQALMLLNPNLYGK